LPSDDTPEDILQDIIFQYAFSFAEYHHRSSLTPTAYRILSPLVASPFPPHNRFTPPDHLASSPPSSRHHHQYDHATIINIRIIEHQSVVIILTCTVTHAGNYAPFGCQRQLPSPSAQCHCQLACYYAASSASRGLALARFAGEGLAALAAISPVSQKKSSARTTAAAKAGDIEDNSAAGRSSPVCLARLTTLPPYLHHADVTDFRQHYLRSARMKTRAATRFSGQRPYRRRQT